ncbi:alkaline phosphatase-like isoform X2 [Acropora muricata]|uniref:alkaline phosphatase-like isoform X2 n=1 Tax=Acropora muricata TaxID=159855 RepID=UPI0034E55FE0
MQRYQQYIALQTFKVSELFTMRFSFMLIAFLFMPQSAHTAYQETNKWYTSGVQLVKNNLLLEPNKKTAKNTILFMGDGMGITTITAARILDGQKRNESGEENILGWERFSWSAQSKTYNVNSQSADSGACATAYLCGVKTNQELIGIDESGTWNYCGTLTEKNKLVSILTLAENAGMSTGFVTTARATHASPSPLYAHSVSGDWESDKDKLEEAKDDATNCPDIALQLVEYPHNNGLEVILAGGRKKMTPKNLTDPEYPDKTGERLDGRNLIKEWVDKYPNSQYVWNKTAFHNIDPNKVNRVMGLFEPGHMKYEVDRSSDPAGEPSIEEMTEMAIKILSKSPKGYFLFVEGARIDHGHHAGRAVRALNDAVAFSEAVKKAVEMVNKDETLLITTADHSHVFTVGGYPKRGNPIFGLVMNIYNDKPNLGDDGKPYTSLGYANGLGGINGTRENLTGVDTADKNFRQQATVIRYKETHGLEDVGIYADGPGAYLFHGVVEQQYIFHVMDHAMCLSESKQGSCNKHVTRGGPDTTTEGQDTTPGSPTKTSVSGQNKAAVAMISLLALLQCYTTL